MGKKSGKAQTPQTKAQLRAKKLAAALRGNLARRKAAVDAGSDAGSDAGPDTVLRRDEAIRRKSSPSGRYGPNSGQNAG